MKITRGEFDTLQMKLATATNLWYGFNNRVLDAIEMDKDLLVLLETGKLYKDSNGIKYTSHLEISLSRDYYNLQEYIHLNIKDTTFNTEESHAIVSSHLSHTGYMCLTHENFKNYVDKMPVGERLKQQQKELEARKLKQKLESFIVDREEL